MKNPMSRKPAAKSSEAAATDRALAQMLEGKRVLIAYGLVGELLAAMHRFGVDYMKSQAAGCGGISGPKSPSSGWRRPPRWPTTPIASPRCFARMSGPRWSSPIARVGSRL
jgi:hypothetical protein